jgi:tyrocidine synthetase III
MTPAKQTNDQPTLAQRIQQLSSDNQRGIGFITGSSVDFITYREFYHSCINTLGYLQSKRIPKGAFIVLQVENSRDFLLIFWASLLGGYTPVPVSLGGSEAHFDKLRAIWTTLHDPFYAADISQFDRIVKACGEQNEEQLAMQITSHYINPAEAWHFESKGILNNPEPGDRAYIQFSSGSTGSPKGVVLTHANLVANVIDILERSRITVNDPALSWMPLTHDMGLICFHLSQLYAGANQYIISTGQFVRNPITWIDHASFLKIRLLYAPNFGLQYFYEAAADKEFPWDLSNIRLIFCGAEPISPKVCKQFIDHLSVYGLKKNVVFPGYGLAEASVAVTLPVPGEELREVIVARNKINIGDKVIISTYGNNEDTTTFVELGYPMDSTELRIVDGDGNILDPSHVGHIQIKGNSVTSGYLNHKNKKDLFSKDGWLKTGDVGFTLNGRLVVTGRYKNIIIFNGQNYYPHDIENVLYTSLAEIRPGHLVISSVPGSDHNEELVAFVLCKKINDQFVDLARKINSIVEGRMGLTVARVVPVTRIPKTTSGKVQYFRLKEMYASGLQAVSVRPLKTTYTQSSVADVIREYVLNTVGKTLDEHDDILASGLTSLQLLRLQGIVRKHTSYELKLGTLLIHPTLSDLIAEKVSSRETRLSSTARFPLTPGQQRLWLMQQGNPLSTSLNIVIGRKINGTLDHTKLHEAFIATVGHHRQLLATFHENGGVIYQELLDGETWRGNIFKEELTGFPGPLDEIINQIVADESLVLFDLSKGPLFRIRITKFNDHESLLVVVVHHLVADGWSIKLFSDDVARCYSGENLLSNKFSFGDYVAEKLAGLEAAKAGSKDYIARLENSSLIFPQPVFQDESTIDKSDTLFFDFGEDQYRALRSLGQNNRASLFSVLVSLLTTLLYKYSGQKEFTIISDSAARRLESEQSIVGYMLSLLLINVRPSGNKTFLSLLNEVHREVIQTIDNEYPVELVLAEKAKGRNDLNVVLMLQNFDDDIPFVRGPAISVSDVDPKTEPPADLYFEFIENANRLRLRFSFKLNKINKDVATILIQQFIRLAEQVLEKPGSPLSSLDILENDVRLRLLKSNDADKIRFSSVVERIDLMASERPDHIAIHDVNQSLTYRQLVEYSQAISDNLRSGSILPGSRVAVLMDRGSHQVAVFIGVLKARCCFVPVDINLPPKRRQLLIESANPAIIITDQSREIKGDQKTIVLNVSDLLTPSPLQYENIYPVGEATAYIMFTSGSRGSPKGVMISHASLVDYVDSFLQRVSLDDQDIVIHQAPLSFDTSIEEIFPILSIGGKVVVSAQGGVNIDRLIEEINKYNVSVLSCTPSLIEKFNKLDIIPPSLRTVISGGEKLHPSHISNLFGKLRVFNSYGPTESTVCVTYHEIKDLRDASLLGQPLNNRNVYLVDEDMSLVPPGAVGQIAIGGTGLAIGYTDASLDATAFVELDTIGRIYLSGDYGRWTNSGSLEFYGRRDEQYKINGHRVETAEIISALYSFHGIEEAIVISRGSPAILCAYFAARSQIDREELLSYLHEYLPYYMVPSHLLQIDKVPRFANGKLDIQGIQNIGQDRWLKSSYVSPQNKTQQALCEIWQRLLAIEDIGIDHSFFALGGDSLGVVRMLSQVRLDTGKAIQMRNFLQMPTIRSLARFASDEVAVSKLNNTGTSHNDKDDVVNFNASYQQQAVWIHQLKQPGSAYNITVGCSIKGKLIVNAFHEAFSHVIDEHPILRSNYSDRGGKIIGSIGHKKIVPFEYRDIHGSAHSGKSLDSIILNLVEHQYQLKHEMLIKAILVQTGDDKFGLLLSVHHIICDGWSIHQIVNDWCNHYKAILREHPIAKRRNASYMTFAEEQSQRYSINSVDYNEAKLFWRSKIENASVVRLISSGQKIVGGKRGNKESITITGKEFSKLEALAYEHNASLAMAVQTLYIVLLYRLTGLRKILLPSITSNRDDARWDETVGFVANTQLIPFQVTPEASFVEILGDVRNETLEHLPYKSLPFFLVQEILNQEKGIDPSEISEYIFIYQKSKREDLSAFDDLENVTVETLDLPYLEPRQTLALNVYEITGGLELQFEYDRARISDEYALRLSQQFITLTLSALEDPGGQINSLQFIPQSEVKALLLLSRSVTMPLPNDSLDHLFEKVVERQRHKVAVSHGKNSLTYEELDRRKNEFAKRLQNGGIVRGDVVGVTGVRSVSLVVALLGTMKAGGTYVYIDPQLPASRKQYIINNASIRAIVSVVDESLQIEILDITSQSLANSSDAYIIYTSGTTGLPKGVPISHRGIINSALAYINLFSLSSEDKYLQFLSLSFDGSLLDIFAALLGGCELVLPEMEVIADPLLFVAELKSKNVSILVLTPTYLRMLGRKELPTVRVLVTAGEEADTVDCNYYAQAHRVFNAYGPTEASVCTTIFEIQNSRSVGKIPIGRPLANKQVIILDEYGQLVPVGVPGEIYIGGEGLSNGYINLPLETARRFVQSKWGVQSRLYRTGDVGYLNESRELVFLRRNDEQVKVGAYRIELGEIESLLNSIPGIAISAVLKKRSDTQGEYLVAFYASENLIEESQLRLKLSEDLPSYMIPAHFVNVTEWPHSPSGKTNRNVLAEISITAATHKAMSEREQEIASIWQQVLNRPVTDPGSNLFAMGGNSLHVIRLAARYSDSFGHSPGMKEMFLHPALRDHVDLLFRERNHVNEIPRQLERALHPASHAQRRIWIKSQRRVTTEFNLVSTYRFDGKLDVDIVRKTFQHLVERHEVLRTVFTEVAGELFQKIQPADSSLFFETFSAANNMDEMISRLTTQEQEYLFDLSKGPLFRVRLLTYSSDVHFLIMNIHHIVSDGWSIPILADEFATIYRALTQGLHDNLKKPTIQYRDFSSWQIDRLKEVSEQHIGFWKNKLDQLPVLELYTDIQRPKELDYHGESKRIFIDERVTGKFEEIANKAGTTLQMVIHALLKLTMYGLTGQRDVVMGTAVGGRDHPQLVAQPGFYVNLLPVRTQLDPSKGFSDFVSHVASEIIEAFDHQDFPFDLIVDSLDLKSYEGHSPVFDIGFTWNDIPEYKGWEGLVISDYDIVKPVAQADIWFMGRRKDNCVELTLIYSKNLFSSWRMDSIVGTIIHLSNEVASNPETILGSIPLVEENQYKQLVYSYNETSSSHPKLPVHEYFRIVASRFAENTAVKSATIQYSYRELDEWSDSLAYEFRERFGIRRGTVVGICAYNTPQVVVTILAILKASASYVIFDPDNPASKHEIQIRHSSPRLLVTTSEHLIRFSEFFEIPLFLLDMELDAIVRRKPLTDVLEPDALAYVMYTSGSTGRPKGVMVPHRAIMRLVVNPNYVDLTSDVRILQTGSIAFDASTFEIWGALLNGGCITIFPTRDLLDVPTLHAKIKEENINTMWFTAAWFNQLVETDISLFETLTQILVGGERLSGYHVSILRNISSARIINGYGPTENTTFSLCHTITKNDTTTDIPLGIPISGSTAYIVDSNMRIVPHGFPGELLLGGEGVASGYLNDDELTSSKYIPDIFTGVGSLYKSGDVCYWDEQGFVRFIGRTDDQVKIRGYRIELDEVRQAMQRHPAIRMADVIVREHEGVKRLVAYYSYTEVLLPGKLSDFLNSTLPRYMVPVWLIPIDDFPLTINGKIDRSKLPEPGPLVEIEQEKPQSESHKRLCDIVSDFIGSERISMNSNFFNEGGDSIRAIKVVSKINSEFGRAIQVKDIFMYPVLKDLAALLEIDIDADATTGTINSYSKENFETELVNAGIDPLSCDDCYPMSDIEKGMMYHSLVSPGTGMYQDKFYYQLTDAAFDVDMFKAALTSLVARHDILRTGYLFDGQSTGLHIVFSHDTFSPDIDFVDLASLTEAERDKYIQQETLRLRTRPFPQRLPGLFCVRIFRLTKSSIGFLWIFHHMILDGWSNASLLNEWLSIYRSLRDGKELVLPPLRSSYRQYVESQLRVKDSERLINFWKDELKDHERTALPFHKIAKMNDEHGEILTTHIEIPCDLASKLQDRAREISVPISQLYLSVFLFTIRVYCGTNHPSIGLVTSCRPEVDDGENVLGCFLNTLPFGINLQENQAPEEIARSVWHKRSLLKEYEAMSLVRIASVAGTEKSGSNPFFDILFGFLDFHILDDALTDIQIDKSSDYVKTNTLFDFHILKSRDSVIAHISTRNSLYQAGELSQFLESFSYYAQCFAETTQQRIQPVANEMLQRLQAQGRGELRELKFDNVVAHILQQAIIHPGKVAIRDVASSITYSNLINLSARLASHLIVNNVGGNNIVGLIMPRSAEMVISLVSILRAGCAFLPIDPSLPRERIAQIIADARPSAIITTIASLELLSTCFEGHIVAIDAQLSLLNDDAILPELTGNQLAYVLYTSGSTGKPKGVCVKHSNLSNYIEWANRYYFNNDAFYPTAFCTPLTFDLTITSIFATLCRGDEMIVITEGDIIEILRSVFVDIPDIRAVKLTPSHLSACRDIGVSGSRVVKLIVGGEELNADHIAVARNINPSLQLFNEYGPTETTVGCVVKKIEHQSFSGSIGLPIQNTTVTVVNGSLQILPPGVPGELLIGGSCVTDGYLGNETLTSERFIVDAENQTHYRTGDKVRWNEEGELVFIGRSDDQVKVRGYRIELAEIDHAAMQFPGIDDCCTLYNTNALLSFCCGNSALLSEDVTRFIETVLPSYMIPTVVVIDKMPLTTNGKIDKKKLIELIPDTATQEAVFVECDEVVLKLFATVLDKPTVHPNDDFFRNGGDSLKAVRLVMLVQKELGKKIQLKDVFELTTPLRLSELLKNIPSDHNWNFEPAPALVSYPLSDIQQRIWFHEKLINKRGVYTIAGAYRMSGELDESRMILAFNKIVNTHKILRTSFYEKSGVPVQEIAPGKFSVVTNVIVPDWQDPSVFLSDLVIENNSEDQLFQVYYFRKNIHEHIIMVKLHHLVCDGISVNIILSDWVKFYNHEEIVEDNRLQYVDYAYHNHEALSRDTNEIADFWQHYLATPAANTALMYDYELRSTRDWSGSQVNNKGQDLLHILEKIAATNNISLFSLLQTAVSGLLYRYTAQREFIIWSPVSGRHHPQLVDMVGPLLKVLPFRSTIDPSLGAISVAKKIHSDFKMILQNQDTFSSELANIKLPPPQVVLVMEDISSRPGFYSAIKGCEINEIGLMPAYCLCDIRIVFQKSEDDLLLQLNYSTDLFAKETIMNFGDNLLSLLSAISKNPGISMEEVDFQGNEAFNENIDIQFDF